MERSALSEWDFEDGEVQAALDELADQFPPEARRELRDIMQGGATNISEAVQEVTDDYGIEVEFTNAWRENDVLSALKYGIKGEFQDLWAGETEAADAIYSLYQDNDMSRLNSMCAEGKYGEVYDELGEPDSFDQPNSFAECARITARAQDIGSTLAGMYRGS